MIAKKASTIVYTSWPFPSFVGDFAICAIGYSPFQKMSKTNVHVYYVIRK